MEDIISIMFIVGMIAGILKSAKESQKNKKGHGKTPSRRNPLPENWGGEAIEMPVTETASTPPTIHTPPPFTHTASPVRDTTPPPRRKQATPPPLYSTDPQAQPEQPTDSNSNFRLDSAEEARRAIVWGEILRRKF